MQCVYTSKEPQWALYHIKKQGGRGRYIDSMKEVEPPTPCEEPITYVMSSTPKELPPWGVLWVCGKEDTCTYPDYGVEILDTCRGILDRDLYIWLLKKYEQYPGALERLLLKLKVLAMLKGGVLLISDVQPLVITTTTTPFLWLYQTLIGQAQALTLIYNASAADLWTSFIADRGLMKYLKSNKPHLVYSLSRMREEVSNGFVSVEDGAILWHLSTITSSEEAITINIKPIH